MKNIYLLLILIIGLFGEENSYIPRVERGIGTYQSAILAPDGKSFYTLKKDLVTEWQLNPIKKLDYFNADIKLTGKDNNYNIHVTSDKSKMIINSNEEILLWDLKTKKQIKKLKVKTVWGLMDDDTFITIDENRVITKYDTKTLKIFQTKQLKDPCDNWSDTYGNSCHSKPTFMMKSEDKLVYFSPHYLLFLEKNSLQVNNSIVMSITGGSLSLDQNTIFYNGKSEYNSYRTINIKTGEIVFLELTENNYLKKHYYSNRKRAIRELSYFNSLTLVYTALKPTLISRTNRRYGFFDNKKEKLLATFLQFEDGKWVLINPEGYFEGSANIKKYLVMRKPNRKIDGTNRVKRYKAEPLNDAIYKKYNKKINLKIQD